MRVLHVITGLGAGGAEQQLRSLVRHLDADSEVATLTNPGVVAAAIRADGTPVHEVGMRGNRDLGAVPRLARLIAAGRFDVVHTHLYRAAVYGRIAARLGGVRRIVATEHSIGDRFIEGRRKTSGVRALYLASERLGSRTIAVSETVARRLAEWGVPRSRIAVIPNGIEPRGFRFDPAVRQRTRKRLGIAPESFVVGGVGRLEPGKRFDVLIDAVAGVEDLTLILVGDGSCRRKLAVQAEELGVASRTIFVGESEDVASELAAVDLLAAPSQEETFGLALLEGLAAGLPVVYTTCPAVDDVSMRPPGVRQVDLSVEAFRRELAAAVAHRPRRREVPAIVDHYDIARLAAQVRSEYDDLFMTSNRRRGSVASRGTYATSRNNNE